MQNRPGPPSFEGVTKEEARMTEGVEITDQILSIISKYSSTDKPRTLRLFLIIKMGSAVSRGITIGLFNPLRQYIL